MLKIQKFEYEYSSFLEFIFLFQANDSKNFSVLPEQYLPISFLF